MHKLTMSRIFYKKNLLKYATESVRKREVYYVELTANWLPYVADEEHKFYSSVLTSEYSR